MPSTIDIRRRIRSVKNTQQITRAMKMVATAKLRRAQERMYAARPYAGGIRCCSRASLSATSSSLSSQPIAACAAHSTPTSFVPRRTSSATTPSKA